MKYLHLPEDTPFHLDCTLSCGQLFRWEKQGDWWAGVVGRKLVGVCQEGSTLAYRGFEENEIRSYFQLDLDLDRVLASIDRDPVIHKAIKQHHGLRLVSQDPWECLISYLCAQNANIPRIRKMVASLSLALGEEIDRSHYAFPSADTLAACTLRDLEACRLGYRAAYLIEAARRVVACPGWADRVALLPYVEARRMLREFPGVGPKVADCVLLFSFQKLEAFPVDVWIRRVVRRYYLRDACAGSPGSCREYEVIRRFGQEYFGEYAGYAQEYLFAAHRGLKEGDPQVPISQLER